MSSNNHHSLTQTKIFDSLYQTKITLGLWTLMEFLHHPNVNFNGINITLTWFHFGIVINFNVNVIHLFLNHRVEEKASQGLRQGGKPYIVILFYFLSFWLLVKLICFWSRFTFLSFYLLNTKSPIFWVRSLILEMLGPAQYIVVDVLVFVDSYRQIPFLYLIAYGGSTQICKICSRF